MEILAVSLLFFFLFCPKACAELIANLPGQPGNVTFKQHSGYIVTDAEHGRALFYYFAEADTADPVSRPLTIWLNGGPGCSSLGFGVFMENGPFQPGKNGVLLKNQYSWNLVSNVLYIESPIGVGFSYSNTSSDYTGWNDSRTAEDNLRFLLNWLEEFPQYKNSELFLTGESYAGHYIPQLATLIVNYNKQSNIRKIKLKAIALGNPLLDLDISVQTGDYLWAHGAISDETLLLQKTVCNDSKFFHEFVQGQLSKECKDVFDQVQDERSGDVTSGDLLLPMCLSPSSTLQFRPMAKRAEKRSLVTRRGTIGDPCLDGRVLAYLNKPEVQKALHANTTHLPYQWAFCGTGGPLKYQIENWKINLIPVVADLIRKGVPVFLYSGDQDAKVPLTQTRIIANNIAKDLKLVPITKYAPWYDSKQVGGWSQSFGILNDGKNVTLLTFATVRGAAHEVPFTSPSQALTLFRSFVRGEPLPHSQY